MSAWADLRASDAFRALVEVSARLGSDPLQVQGPGGNTSLKRDGAMWVKASGAWLAEAATRDIMAPVDAAALTAALDADRPDADFVPEGEGAAGLRPSIETSFHAALPWPAVLHTHCVATIAAAIRADAEAFVAERLRGVEAIFVPYCMPGRDLTRAILSRIRPETRVIVLGNHGLICCGEDVGAADRLLREVSRALDPGAAPPVAADPDLAAELAGAGWRPAPDEAQVLALDPRLTALAAAGTFYPDHAVFLGPGVAVAREGAAVREALDEAAAMTPPRKLVLFPGRGAAIPDDASPALRAMARALGDVLVRVAPGAELRAIDEADVAALVDWDAEKYRKSLSGAP